jgi:hypothetical protein
MKKRLFKKNFPVWGQTWIHRIQNRINKKKFTTSHISRKLKNNRVKEMLNQ